MSISKEEFKDTMRRWASGITIVTTQHVKGIHAMTASSFTSLSMDPPLIMVAVNKKAFTHQQILDQQAFGVMILHAGQEAISNGGAGFLGEEGHHLLGVSYRKEKTGAPILDECSAWMDCSLHNTHDSGDHTIFVGKIEATGCYGGEPLLWYGRGYHTLLPLPSQKS